MGRLGGRASEATSAWEPTRHRRAPQWTPPDRCQAQRAQADSNARIVRHGQREPGEFMLTGKIAEDSL